MAEAQIEEKYSVPPESTKCVSDGDGDGLSNLPGITMEEEVIESRSVSNEERLLAFADLYGQRAPDEFDANRHLEAFDREMSRLPAKKKRALHQGYTVKQARLFLIMENNDAKRAVVRMASYWENRFQMLGDGAFAERTPDRSEEDYRRIYEMAVKIPMDPEVDSETRCWAEKFVHEWNWVHLVALDEQLANTPDHEKAAFVEAVKTVPDMAASEEHKLLFLRSENFDAKQACRRMMKYWDLKCDLFGEGAFRLVTVNDLMKDHPGDLSAGSVWYMQGTDIFGRDLFYYVPGKMFESLTPEHGCTEKGLLKVIWYMHHSVLEREKSCSENGVVLFVDDRFTNVSTFKTKFAFKVHSLLADTLPLNIKAMHVFAPPSWTLFFFQKLLPFAKWLLGRRMRMRLWVHTGKKEETLSHLERCGIPRELIPATLGGNMDIDHVGKAWLEERREVGL